MNLSNKSKITVKPKIKERSKSIHSVGEVYEEAVEFIDLAYKELGKSEEEINVRKEEIFIELQEHGTYTHTFEELDYGCKLAWRHNTHCIGKPHWKILKVIDHRKLFTEAEIFKAIVDHISYSTNKGQILSAVSIFPPSISEDTEIRIWNPQLIRYAGYKQDDGSILGDPDHVELTEEIMKLGWTSKERGPFDVLPIVIQIGSNEPKYYELPKSIILEVPILHPRNERVAKIGMKWHALPAITNMFFKIGGIKYTAAPFNGWYMNTEIVQNLANHNRYNLLPLVADALHIPVVKEEKGLWQDIAFAELSLAVYYSFQRAGIKMVDHYTASRQFVHFMETEAKRFNRIVPAKYSWVVPACASSLFPIYHQRMYPLELKPFIGYNTNGWNRKIMLLPRGEILESELRDELESIGNKDFRVSGDELDNDDSYGWFSWSSSSKASKRNSLGGKCPFSSDSSRKYKSGKKMFSLTGLIVIGAVLIPAVYLLRKKRY